MNILPFNNGYESPKQSNNYMKLQEGENKFRILSPAVYGWEDWVNKKPVRYKMNEKPAKPFDETKPVKHFWAFIVWNYAEEKIQMLQITQASLRNALEPLCTSEDWGAPFFYDIKIHKKGEGINTEYSLTPVPHKPLAPHVEEAFKNKPCNLEALFDDMDPFASGQDSYTKGVFSKEDAVSRITKQQAMELEDILSECDEKYQAQVKKFIEGSQVNAKSIAELPVEFYEKILTAAQKKAKEAQMSRAA